MAPQETATTQQGEVEIGSEKSIAARKSENAEEAHAASTETGHVFVNDAQGGMGSVYWSYCYGKEKSL